MEYDWMEISRQLPAYTRVSAAAEKRSICFPSKHVLFLVFPGMHLFHCKSYAASIGIKWVYHPTVNTWLWRKCLDSGVLTFMDHLMLLTSQLTLNSKRDGMRLYCSSAKCLHCLQLAAFKPSVFVHCGRGRRGMLNILYV